MKIKMVKCKTCGSDIAKSANRCPNCGANLVMKKPGVIIGLIFWILALFLLFRACNTSLTDKDSGPKRVDDTSGAGTTSIAATGEAAEALQPAQDTFGVGEKVSLNDIVVTMTDVSESSGADFFEPSAGNVFIFCSFNIENNSDKDIAVSSLLSFETYVDDYSTSFSLSATLASGETQLDGTVAAGKKMAGVIGYEVSEDWAEVEVRFTPNFWSGKDIKFVASK